MGRSRSRSYSPTRRDRSPFRRNRRRDDDVGARRKSWRGRELGGRYASAPTSLLVRNIARDSRAEDVRIPFERFGPVKDVYLPKDYYSGRLPSCLVRGPSLLLAIFYRPFKICPQEVIHLSDREPRGFGFVQYLDPADAGDAQYHMDRQFIAGREITVVFAEENRKKPCEMRGKERSSTPTGREIHSGGRGGGFSGDKYRKRSPGHRFRSLSRSSSPPARRHTSRDQFAARDKRSKHGPSGSSAKNLSSPEANGQRARKSWSRSLSPLALSSASKSDFLE